jgi:O-6-methylguanine DNA methyltransferase
MAGALFALPIATEAGVFLATYSEKGLAKLAFPGTTSLRGEQGLDSRNDHPSERLKGTVPPLSSDGAVGRQLPKQIRRWHQVSTRALRSILAGRAPKVMPPLDWAGATDFQQSVWRQMLKLRPGKTMSYGEIAAAIGKPNAVRAVGGACGANPIPVLVPCHRILAAHKKIGGFSGGLAWKRRLLAREGLDF